MRLEALGWSVSATSLYAFLLLVILLKTRAIDYSPFDFVIGVAVGLLVVVLIVAFLAGVAIVIHEAASRQHQLWP